MSRATTDFAVRSAGTAKALPAHAGASSAASIRVSSNRSVSRVEAYLAQWWIPAADVPHHPSRRETSPAVRKIELINRRTVPPALPATDGTSAWGPRAPGESGVQTWRAS